MVARGSTVRVGGFWISLGIAAALGGCAGNQVVDEINRAHDTARIADDAPLTVDRMTEPGFLKQFAAENCGIDRDLAGAPEQKRRFCDDKLKQALFDAFSERYFAADRKAIEARCQDEALACKDPKILEGWIRASHNAGIEASRQEKLVRQGELERKLASQSMQNRIYSR